MTISSQTKRWSSAYLYVDAIQIFLLLAIFAYYFVENFVMSGGWEMLALRSVDDAAMQGSIHIIHKAVMSGDFRKLFSTYDYAYGNAFWLLNSILLFPFYLIGNAHAEIVAGRQISLLFCAGSVYYMGQIIEILRPDARRLKYPLMMAMALSPMFAIIATKLHVNAQSLFWGTLAFYYLIRQPHFTRKDMVWSAVFAGMAVGFKLTGIFLMPLLGLTLLGKIWSFNYSQKAKEIAIFGGVFTVVAAACLFPPLLLFPFFGDKISEAYKAFLMFKGLAVISGNNDLFMKLVNSLSYFMGPLAMAVSSLLYCVMMAHDVKRKKFISSFVLLTLLVTIAYVVLTVDKDAAYVGTYMLSVSLFLPFGLLGIASVRVPEAVKLSTLYLVVLSSLACATPFQQELYKSFNFFRIVKSERVKDQLLAVEEIRPLVTPLELPVRILQDCESVFPATMYQDGVFVGYIFGDLKDKVMWGLFDYILLSRNHYIGMPQTPLAFDKDMPLDKLSGVDLEEALRARLHDKGEYAGRKYKLIYDRYDSLLYKLVKKPQ